MTRTASWVVLGVSCGALLGCGGAQPPPVAPPPKAEVAAPTPPAEASRAASASLRRYWPFGKTAEVAVYADAHGFSQQEVIQHLIPSARAAAGEVMRPGQAKCAEAVMDAARTLAVGSDPRGNLALLEVSDEGERAVRSACVGSVVAVDRVKVTGADEAYARDNDVVVLEPGVILFGEKPVVEAALASHGTPFPDALALSGEQQIKWLVKLQRQVEVTASGSFSIGHDALTVRTLLDLPSEAMAQELEAGAGKLRAQASAEAPEQTRAMVTKLFDAVSVHRSGKQVDLAFEVKGGPEAQAAAVGTVASLGIYGVRKYIAQAKTAEARNTLGQIGKDYAVYLYEDGTAPKPGARKPKKLVSLPPVPATIPRGTKYQSSPDDWKAWDLLKFSFAEPQYFQYEVVAAKDGKTAIIYARGDLDGDGTASEFRLPISVDPKTGAVQLGPELQESNPTE
jgi:type IV pilus assembly protein PilA